MNAKFFDLKQEKQDRIINAALKIFAKNGYNHASTDDMVKEAQISKGLLFHYFDSKIGVYSFLYDYAVRLIAIELGSAIDPSETSYFEILRQMEAAKMLVLRSHPYMYMFLNSTKRENITEAILATEESKKTLENNLGTILARTNQDFLKENKSAKDYLKMMDCTLEAIMEDALLDGSFNADMNYKESIKYINLTEKMI